MQNFDFYDMSALKSYNLDKNMQYQLKVLDSLDLFTRKHSENVASLVCRLCEYLHCSEEFTEYCTICAYLHDIGKQAIPPTILQKNGALTDEEYEIMKTHTTIGYKICMNDIKLRPYAAGTIYHHEALDGTGYPNGLVGSEIPKVGQILRVADEFDAISSRRQYKTHVGIVDTIKILIENSHPTDPNRTREPIKDPTVGKNNPKYVKTLIKVIIDDTEYEISCLMDDLKKIKAEVKRLEEIEKYDNKRLSENKPDKQAYYLEGIKYLLKANETLDNYSTFLNSYRKVLNERNDHIDALFAEIKELKRLKV